MSTSIRAGGLITMDPSDILVMTFDWDTEALPIGVSITSYTHTITAIRQAVNPLTKDNESNTARATQLRLNATTATIGDKYLISSRVVTNEAPPRTIERSFSVLIEQN
jgi:hypothetical protein